VTLLAVETATRCVGCALWADGGLLASFALVAGQRHAEVLMPAVDGLCRRTGTSRDDLEAVAVDVGPGLFTGLRVGLATARAIAAALDLPAAGVTSLEALAHPHRRRPGLVVPVVDARRGEVYWAVHRSDGTRAEELRPPSVSSPDSVCAELVALGVLDAGTGPRTGPGTGHGVPLLAVGDGAWRYRALLGAAGAEVAGPAEMWPSPAVIAELGAARLAASAGGALTAGLPVPVYLRQADVRIGWEQVGGRAGPAATAGPSAPARLGP
jgi:tRNA threonylcarbamoyladenosine biosynthesis protein TsaB